MVKSKKSEFSTLIKPESSDLQSFFYAELEKINGKKIPPLSQEIIFYAGNVLENYVHTDKFFDHDGEKFQNKILGMKLMEASQFPKSKQKRS